MISYITIFNFVPFDWNYNGDYHDSKIKKEKKERELFWDRNINRNDETQDEEQQEKAKRKKRWYHEGRGIFLK